MRAASLGYPVLLRDSHTPWMNHGVRSPLLEKAALSLKDEVEAFRNFAVTRVGRQFTRAIVGSVAYGAFHATKIKWLRYTVKGAVRFVPIVGWGLLAYDLYNLGEDLDLY